MTAAHLAGNGHVGSRSRCHAQADGPRQRQMGTRDSVPTFIMHLLFKVCAGPVCACACDRCCRYRATVRCTCFESLPHDPSLNVHRPPQLCAKSGAVYWHALAHRSRFGECSIALRTTRFSQVIEITPGRIAILLCARVYFFGAALGRATAERAAVNSLHASLSREWPCSRHHRGNGGAHQCGTSTES
jgi:hypothetical protein